MGQDGIRKNDGFKKSCNLRSEKNDADNAIASKTTARRRNKAASCKVGVYIQRGMGPDEAAIVMITLRPYQQQARDAAINAWNDGKLNVLIPSPTGSGKTEIGLAVLAKEVGLHKRDRALWIAHRRELIFQPRDRAIAHWETLPRPGVVMAGDNECAARFVIATVQTLAAKGRLEAILEHGPITHLVTDEAHHSVSKTYVDIYKVLRYANPDLRHLGLTATPKRTDGDGLSAVFDAVPYRIKLKDLIRRGHLAPFVTFGCSLPVSFDEVKSNRDGWSNDEAGDILSARNVEEIVISKWKEHAVDRPTIAFTASVAQAHSLAQHFREAGFSFEALDGTTKKRIRADILARFKAGELQGVVNCAVLTEGFDAPHASCLLQVRPTKSDLVYMQMAGRVLRIAPGKENALILDFCPADARDMVMGGDLLGKPRKQRKAEEKAEQQGIIGACGINRDGEGIDGDPDKVIMQMLDYMSMSSLSWYVEGLLASASIGEKRSLAVVLADDVRKAKADELKAAGQWNEAWDRVYDEVSKFHLVLIESYKAHLLGAFESWEDASCAADEWVEENGTTGTLAKKSARWRGLDATDKQKALLVKFKVWDTLKRQDRGTAAKAITHFFASRALHKKR